MKKATTAVIAATMVGALGLGIGATNLAAADTTPTPVSSVTETDTKTQQQKAKSAQETGKFDRHPGRHGFGHHVWHGKEGASDLAKKLGVSKEKLMKASREMREAFKNGEKPNKDEFTKTFAEKLGVDQQKLIEALEELRAEHRTANMTALKARVEAAVANGKLTQAEGDAVIKAAEKGVIGMPHGPRR